MNWTTECAVVIPCRDESGAVGGIVEAVRRTLPVVFVVDDGSKDATAARAGSAGAEVLRHRHSRGKGAALQTGWSQARRLGFRWVLTMDGDGQHAPEDIPVFLDQAEQFPADLLVGNRMGGAEQMPPLRRYVNRWMSERLSRAAGCSLPDSQCGFRLIHLESLATLPIATNHFEIESEVLLGFVRGGFRIRFVPIQIIYRAERSKIHPLCDTLRWFHWWWRVKKSVHSIRVGTPACAPAE